MRAGEQTDACRSRLGRSEVDRHARESDARHGSLRTLDRACGAPPGDTAVDAGAVGDGTAHSGCRRPGRAVRTVEPGLEAGARRVVAEAEDVDLRDVGITGGAADELPVDRGLRLFVGDRDVLCSHVPVATGRVDLPAHLVEVQPEPVDGRRLGRAGECVPERLPDPVEVDEAGVRPRVAATQRVGRRVRVGMEAEAVHQRPLPASCPVPGPERRQEPDGRGRHIAPGRGTVVPTGREPDPDHGERLVDVLERVVPGSEERPERPAGELLAPCELRTPEGRLIGLVAHDELPHLGVAPRELGEPRAERLRAREPGLDLAGRIRIRREDDREPRRSRSGDRQVEQRPLGERERVARLPAHRDHRLPEAEGGHLGVERRSRVGRELPGVVVRPDVGARRDTRADQCRDDRGRERPDAQLPPLPHAPQTPSYRCRVLPGGAARDPTASA